MALSFTVREFPDHLRLACDGSCSLEETRRVFGEACALAAAAAGLLLAACATAPAASDRKSFVDPRDGQRYGIVRLGAQEWHGRDLAFDAPDSHCYDDRDDDCPPHGRLYPWHVATNACPAGWRLPRESDWQALERHLGMPEDALRVEGLRGTDQGARLRRGGDSGFDAPFSGYRRPDGSHARRGERSAYWLATAADGEAAWHRDVRSDRGGVYRSAVPTGYALSVRCMRDAAPADAAGNPASQARGVVRDSKIAGGTG